MATYTQIPAAGDYIVGRTGVSWSVNRSLGGGEFARLREGVSDASAARGDVIAAARADATDAWETAGRDEFRRLAAYRPR